MTVFKALLFNAQGDIERPNQPLGSMGRPPGAPEVNSFLPTLSIPTHYRGKMVRSYPTRHPAKWVGRGLGTATSRALVYRKRMEGFRSDRFSKVLLGPVWVGGSSVRRRVRGGIGEHRAKLA